MMDGINYVFRNGNCLMSVQEQFKDSKYQDFLDLTIRYRRDDNKIEERHESDYYKMKTHYFTYEGCSEKYIRINKMCNNRFEKGL